MRTTCPLSQTFPAAVACALLLATAPAAAGENTFDPADPAVRNWTVLGPFPNNVVPGAPATGPNRAGWDRDYLEPLGGEAAAQITSTTRVDWDGETIAARTATANPGGVVDLIDAFGAEPDGELNFKLCYSFATLDSPRGFEAHAFFGSDDAAKVWINGELVYEEWVPGRGVTPREEYWTFPMAEGTNTILIKNDNVTGDYGFKLEIADDAGREMIMREKDFGPPDFTRFTFEGAEPVSDSMNQHLWNFFYNRLGFPNSMFYQEYMMIADIWLNATAPGGMSIQDLKRSSLLSAPVLDDGYVSSRQHISESYDFGWPFPVWTQFMGWENQSWLGYTYGWHFFEGALHFGAQRVTPNSAGLPHFGERATEGWDFSNVEPRGMGTDHWILESTGPDPALTTPEGIVIDAFNAPFLQMRWRRSGDTPAWPVPYIEWMREGDTEWSPARRAYLWPTDSEHEGVTGFEHRIAEMYTHPMWDGTIERMRINLAPGEEGTRFELMAFFTAYDTRHTINNPIYVMACWEYFRWTGDLDFLRQVINKMRVAHLYQMKVMNGAELAYTRNDHFKGHDGIPGWFRNEDGSKTPNPGHGKGNSYFDLLPFGWDDMYQTSQYHGSTLAMAAAEEVIARNPGWNIPRGALAFDAEELRAHAGDVREKTIEMFWDEEKGRYIGAIDARGVRWDYGFTFVNLEAMWYGVAPLEQRQAIYRWLDGETIVEGDTSTGEDIYFHRFGPRITTKRNIEWYGQGWWAPEDIPWGEQIQDGGAVLGFTFYDWWGRLRTKGIDDAWERVKVFGEYLEDVREEGGFRQYYDNRGLSMQGGGTPGGIGVDYEFLESSIPPAFVPYGMIGMNPLGDALELNPALPAELPSVSASNIMYWGARMDVTVTHDSITIDLKDRTFEPIRLVLPGTWVMDGETGSGFVLDGPGTYRIERADRTVRL